jgi:hypothetical protein
MQEARSEQSSDKDVQAFTFSKDQVSKMRFEGADALYRIKLRLNKNETEHNELEKLLDATVKIQNEINILKGKDYTKALEAIDRASSYSQDILKTEWERVKNGETSFRVARNWVMPAIMLISLVFISILLFSSPEPNKSIQPTAEAATD